MLKNRIVILFALLLLVVVPFMGVAAQDQTIAEVAAANPDLSTLVSLVEAAGLTDVLAGEGPYTVFAPTNEAFAALPPVVVEYLGAHADVLTRVLTYHVTSGAVMSADITDMMAPSMEMSAVGGDMTGSELDVKVTDAGVTVNGANVVTSDVAASNGVVHVIDAVLVPDLGDLIEEVVPATLTGDIAIDGSSTVEPLTVAVQEAFQGEGFSGNISVGESGTGGGFAAFCEEGVVDIANASRGIRTGEGEEASICEANGRPAVGFRVGTDGIAIVVSSSNDFANDLTYEELQAVFSTATNWSDVRADFPAEPILRYAPGTDSGTYDFFNEQVFPDADPSPLLAASNLTPSENDNVLVQGVESSPYAVGFFGYAYYLANAESLKLLSIDGVTPDATSVEDGSYLLARPLYIYSSPGIVQEKPQVAGFINYYIANVNNIIGDVGYFPASAASLNRAKLWYIAAATPAA
jgi:phosphate transport system substrate-binding protein